MARPGNLLHTRRYAAQAWFLRALSQALTCSVAAGCSDSNTDTATTFDRAQLLDPETCQPCHSEHYRQWSGSMHAYAAEDPVFIAMNQRGQRETDGELGDFCVRCHAPVAVLEGLTSDGLNLDELPQAVKGVTCYFCHSVDAVEGTHNNPLRVADDLVLRGSIDDPVDSAAHRSAYSALHDRDRALSSELCGSCHDIVVNDSAPIERTFAEWQASVFAAAGGATCGQCHMPQSPELRPIASTAGAPPRRQHDHSLPGIDLALTPFPEREAQRLAVEELLGSTLQSALCVVDFGGSFGLRVILDNVGAGHGFPSGSSQDRRVWIELIAEQANEVVYRSGVVEADAPVTESEDPDLWLLRDCMLNEDGEPVSMFWEAYDYETNQLPALSTLDPSDPRFYQTHFVKNYPRAEPAVLPGLPDRVTLRVLVRPVGLDVLDELIESGDLDPDVRDAMPTIAIDLGDGPVLEWTEASVNSGYLENSLFEARCVSATGLDVTADKTPAPARTSCSP